MKRATALALCLVPLSAFAQSDDRGYLTAFLEDNLSGAGRQVVITGFEGALSSQAKIAELTIADDLGVWLTLRNVVLDWNRAALLTGNVSVNELSASEIVLTRRPVAEATAPQPEAGSFSLPELPVSVEIGRLAAGHISLGPDVLGQPVDGTLEASLSLSGGIGAAKLLLQRQDDGPEGRISLTASYTNESRILDLDLQAIEGAGRLVAKAHDLPGAPATALSIQGKGPVSDYIADISLATDGAPRLAGRVVTQSAKGQMGFAANLSGNLAPLFLREYADFFGDRVELIASGTAHDDGRIDLSRLRLGTKALDLAGNLSLSSDGRPVKFALQGKMAHADGAPVLLPLTTSQPIRLSSADLAISYDAAQGDGWTSQTTVYGLNSDSFQTSLLSLTGSGRIAPGQFGGTFSYFAEGLSPTDAAMAKALGSVLSGDAVLFYRGQDGALSLPRMTLQGEDYRAAIKGGRISGLKDGLSLSGSIAAELQDISRLDAVAQMPLAGAAKAEVAGRYVPLTGAFDVQMQADGQDLALGQPMLDGMLGGASRLSATLRRDESGLRVIDGRVAATSLVGQLDGVIASAASDLGLQLAVSDLSVLGQGAGGALGANVRLTGPLETAHIAAEAKGQGLRSGNAELDKLLRGESRISADLDLVSGQLRINRADLTSPEVKAQVSGIADGASQTVTLAAELRNLGLLLPEFPGPVTLTGKVVNDGAGASVDITGKGPGGIDATVKGRVAAERSDLTIRGKAQAALANAFVLPRSVAGQLGFDLRLNGPLALSSLSGPVTLQAGRLSDPALAFAFDGISARADLAAGQAKVSATLPLTTQGQVAISGTIGLSEPFLSALGIALQGVTLRDPDLYETRLRGALQLTGPMLSRPRLAGRIDLIETELRVPSTGFGGAAGLPELRHINEPSAVRETRRRAGLLEDAAAAARSGGGDLELDVTVSAPSRLFVRGRGLDAELGGEVRLLGRLSALAPVGVFNLIRGRLEILGKRFDIDEASLQMEGDLIPFLRVVASTENDGITANIEIEGRADDPKVRFTSSPELPEEEVLAQLLFGQGLQNLSPLQALQLASAVATLAGRGGEGVISRLRTGIGVDNLDVKTNAQGGAEVTAGKYISKNAYTEVTVGQDGRTEINLNLDLTDSLTARAGAGSDGQTGLGLFYEKDY